VQGLVSDVRHPCSVSWPGSFGLSAQEAIALEHSRLER